MDKLQDLIRCHGNNRFGMGKILVPVGLLGKKKAIGIELGGNNFLNEVGRAPYNSFKKSLMD